MSHPARSCAVITALALAAAVLPSSSAVAASTHPATGSLGAAVRPAQSRGATPVGTPARTTRSYLASLATLVVRNRVTSSGYLRASYGRAWVDVDRNGCTQRQDALWVGLLRSRPATLKVRGTCRHEVYAGTWIDPYTGSITTATDMKKPAQAQRVQIDHVVALAEADRSGAHSWSAARKLAFANDRLNLVASAGKVNQSKSAHDAAAWSPKGPYQCAYAARVVVVKRRWALSVDPAEKAALTRMLGTCRTNSIQLGHVARAERPAAAPRPVVRPTPRPRPAPRPTPVPAPGRDYNCSDFRTWSSAQALFTRYLPRYGDVFGLDADHDGIACESLPGAPRR